MRVSVNKFLENPMVNSDLYYNFYDWFCDKNSLSSKMERMVPQVRFLVKQGIIDGDRTYVWFKNTASIGGTFDDMRFSTLNETDDYLGCFCRKAPDKAPDNEKGYISYIYSTKLGYMEFKNWSTFKKRVKTDAAFKAELVKAFAVKK